MAKKVKKKARHASGPKQKRSPLSKRVDRSNKELVVEKEKLNFKVEKPCKHAVKGMDLEKFSVRIKRHGNVHCHACQVRREKKISNKKQPRDNRCTGENGNFNSSYICLGCGHVGCGQSDDPLSNVSHAFKHWQTTNHPYAVPTGNPVSCWCFECGVYITVGTKEVTEEKTGDSNEALLEALKFIKEHLSTDSQEDAEATSSNSNSQEVDGQPEYHENSVSDEKDGDSGNVRVVRGLLNLGNTCFLNSVMQNLLTLETLRDHFKNARMSNTGSISLAMMNLYKETSVMTKGLSESKHVSRNSGSINPKTLFNSICSKAPQFRGYDQHDSHELLRCLLDGLNSEEIAFQKASVDTKVENEQNKASLSNGTFVDRIFGGQLSSTVCCLDCGYSSVVHEPFLDLSLPVPKKTCPFKKKAVVPPAKKTSTKAETSCRDKNSRGKTATLPTSLNAATDSVDTSLPCSELSSSGVPSNVPVLEETSIHNMDCSWLDYLGPAILSDESSCRISLSASEDRAESYDCSATSVAKEQGCTYVMEPSQTSENGCVLEHDGQFSQPNLTDETILGFETNLPCEYEPQRSCTYKLSGGCNGNDYYPIQELLGYESSGESKVDEIPLMVKDSEVLLLPYKEVDPLPINPNDPSGWVCDNVPLKETKLEPFPILGYEEKNDDFDGFGGLFNEPEPVESGLASGSPQEMETILLAGSSSESNQEEVDDTKYPVSVDACLADFFKPELLSGEHAWNCENCSKIFNCESNSHGEDSNTGSTLAKSQENGDCFKTRKSDTGQGFVGTSENEVLQCGDVFVDQLSIFETHSRDAGQHGDVLKSNEPLLENCDMEQLPDNCQKANRVLKHKPRISGKMPKLKSGNAITSSCNTVVIKRDATKRFLINRAPPVLTIHLKRFSQDARGRLSKLSGHVNFQETLNLKPYMDPRCTDESSCAYLLVGVVEHSGTMRGGHYVAYVRGQEKRVSTMSTEDSLPVGTWYYVSDHHVREASRREVLQSEAYILFYERRRR